MTPANIKFKNKGGFKCDVNGYYVENENKVEIYSFEGNHTHSVDSEKIIKITIINLKPMKR